MSAMASIDLLEARRREALALAARAEAATRHYNRTTWVRFVLVFFPIPFAVALFRLHIEAWAYYVAGALIIASGAALYILDGIASAKADAAVDAAEKAHQAYEAACRELNPPG
jgi:hypothetical protein